MTREIILTHEFVEYIPDHLKDGVVYVSIAFATAAHKCCCGCGKEVITPLSPTDWKLIFDGKSVSLDPSIGNWGYACKSHYWIKNDRVKWAAKWTQEEIQYGRTQNIIAKAEHFKNIKPPIIASEISTVVKMKEKAPKPNMWRKLTDWLF